MNQSGPDSPRKFVLGKIRLIGLEQVERHALLALRLFAADSRRIEVWDMLKRAEEAETLGILATPTRSDGLVTRSHRTVGYLSNIDEIIKVFGCRREDNRE